MGSMPLDFVSGLDQAVDAAAGGAQQYRAWVPGAVIALEEMGVPLPVPGDVLVAYLGYRLATGSMSLAEILPQLLLGIVAGSFLLFVASRRWGHRMIDRYGFIWHLTPRRRMRAERLATRWGFWSVAVGRHFGLRVPMTLMAGTFGMARRSFTQSVLISSTVWVAIWLIVGGRAGAPARDLFSRVSYGGVIAAIAIYLCIFVLPPLIHIVRGGRLRLREDAREPEKGPAGSGGLPAPAAVGQQAPQGKHEEERQEEQMAATDHVDHRGQEET
ncbi:MAG: hypothetical protein NVSMB29_09050 [Candidatus Dormibacteria bacterium]